MRKRGVQSSRLRHVARAEPGIDKHEPDFGLDQQAMADDLGGSENRAMTVPEPAAKRTHRTAAEVVDSHRCAPVLRAKTPGARPRFGAPPILPTPTAHNLALVPNGANPLKATLPV
jgi:hypothetical protein